MKCHAPLNVHSHYSFLRGIPKINILVETAKKRGCDALALTDTANLYGAIPFYKECKKNNIKPIIGVTIYINDVPNVLSRLVLLAKNENGYKNLMRLITFHRLSNKTSDIPSMNIEELGEFSKNIIAILPFFNSPITNAIRFTTATTAKAMLKKLHAIFHTSLYAGMSTQVIENISTEKIEKMYEEISIPLIPMTPIYYLDDEDAEARDVLLRIQPTRLSDIEEDIFENVSLKLPSRKQEQEQANIKSEWYENLAKLIDTVNIEITIGNWVFPKPPVSEFVDHKEQLRSYVEDGLVYRKLKRSKKVSERIEYELSIINDRNYTDYFLTMIDLVQFMHRNAILTSTRGSAAGSLVSYLTRITNVNPLEYDLPFERFLNPYRPTAPDIDIDVSDNRRSEIIEYVTKRYGKEKVAQIGTFGTMMARAAVRDTTRALNYSYIMGNRIARLIPFGKQGQPMTIDKAMDEVQELRTLYNNEKAVRHILDTAKRIEGNARHISVHAAGIVIAPKNLIEYTPLEHEPKGGNRPITQYNMHAVEDVGLLKFDLLGLTNLAILADSLKRIEKNYNKKIDIDIMPLTDQKVFKFISEGYTTGIFQLGGSGMTNVLKKMKPNSMYDLAACIALYRPGPMKNIDEYIERKHGKKEIVYLHPKMKEYLEQSYGVLVYQEDLLYTALNLANYNWKEVDVFRKAVGKKNPQLMAQQEKLFKERVMQHSNMTKKQADELWNLFDPFKGYGFNKAHAMSYAKVSYQTAYIKKYYSAEYMAAHLTAEAGNTERIADLIFEVRRLGIKILPTDIQHSEDKFTTEIHTDEKGNRRTDIRIGLENIRHLGTGVIETILETRNKKQFERLEDFLQRGCRGMNKQALESLIKVGCLSVFGERGMLLNNLNTMLTLLKEVQNSKENQGMLFTSGELPTSSLRLKTIEPVKKSQGLAWEKDLLGFYVTGHPLHSFKPTGVRPLSKIQTIGNNKNIDVMGVITRLRPTRTKDGNLMYFLTLEDDNNEKLEAVCFSDAVQRYEEMLVPTRTVTLRGRTSTRNNEVTLRVQEVLDPQ